MLGAPMKKSARKRSSHRDGLTVNQFTDALFNIS
jgi:hypothetical protein